MPTRHGGWNVTIAPVSLRVSHEDKWWVDLDIGVIEANEEETGPNEVHTLLRLSWIHDHFSVGSDLLWSIRIFWRNLYWIEWTPLQADEATRIVMGWLP